MILIDSRERKLAELINKKNIPHKITYLEVADLICFNLGIERKTRQDFENSIKDLRLFKQLKELKNNFSSCLLIVEGQKHNFSLSKQAIMGAYSSIIIDFQIPIFFTKNEEKTVEVIESIYKHMKNNKKNSIKNLPKKSNLTIKESQEAIITSFPLIGPKNAKALLNHFGSIKNIANANIDELCNVKGIGKSRAKILFNLINKEY